MQIASFSSGSPILQNQILQPATYRTSEAPLDQLQSRQAWDDEINTLTNQVKHCARRAAEQLSSDASKVSDVRQLACDLKQQTLQISPLQLEGSNATALFLIQNTMLAGALDAVVYHATRELGAPLLPLPVPQPEEGESSRYATRLWRGLSEETNGILFDQPNQSTLKILGEAHDQVPDLCKESRRMESDAAGIVASMSQNLGQAIGTIVGREGTLPELVGPAYTAQHKAFRQQAAEQDLAKFNPWLQSLPGVSAIALDTRTGPPRIVVTARDEANKEILRGLLAHQLGDTPLSVQVG